MQSRFCRYFRRKRVGKLSGCTKTNKWIVTFEQNWNSERYGLNKIQRSKGAEMKVEKTEAEWRELLTPEQFHVTRKHGTERAFSGPNWDNHETGQYRCVCCNKPLFRSETKFESGTGWPSFFTPADPQAVTEHKDRGFFMTRTEIRCSDCDAHLGHVFNDGPRPTGLRYCMNGTAMVFDPD
jgi:peptide-methionine (R)-S-oxide reductase